MQSSPKPMLVCSFPEGIGAGSQKSCCLVIGLASALLSAICKRETHLLLVRQVGSSSVYLSPFKKTILVIIVIKITTLTWAVTLLWVQSHQVSCFVPLFLITNLGAACRMIQHKDVETFITSPCKLHFELRARVCKWWWSGLLLG